MSEDSGQQVVSISKASVTEGVLDAVKIGSGETYVSAFGVFLQGSQLQIGTLSSLPPLIGAMCQTVSVFLMEKAGSRRDLVTRLIRMQGLLLVPMALIPLWLGPGHATVSWLIAFFAMYHMTIGLLAPIWNSWMGDLVPSETRGMFFGFRNRCMAIATFTALIISGGVLNLCSYLNVAIFGFVAIFLVAGLVRYRAARALDPLPNPPYQVAPHDKFTFWQFIRRAHQSNFVKFVFFVSCMNLAVAFAGPYFAVYMLRDLHLSYVKYTAVISASVIGQFLVLQGWGRLSDQFGNRKILAVCGWQVALNPFMWLISDNIYWLILIQFYSGVFWAGFNLAAANFVFDAVTPPKRARCIAYQAIINGVLVFCGSMIGGYITSHWDAYLPLHQVLWSGTSVFLNVFCISGIMRIVAVTVLLRKFKEVRPVKAAGHREILVRIAHVQPITGAAFSFLGRAGRAVNGDDK